MKSCAVQYSLRIVKKMKWKWTPHHAVAQTTLKQKCIGPRCGPLSCCLARERRSSPCADVWIEVKTKLLVLDFLVRCGLWTPQQPQPSMLARNPVSAQFSENEEIAAMIHSNDLVPNGKEKFKGKILLGRMNQIIILKNIQNKVVAIKE